MPFFESSRDLSIALFMMLFAAILGFSIIYVAARWLKDKRAPRIVVRAALSNKRAQEDYVYRQRNTAPGMRTQKRITYYVTFALESGGQIELRVSKPQYLKLKKGYKGTLTYQSARYIGFERD